MNVSSLESRERQYTSELERLNRNLTSAIKKESETLKKISQLNTRLLNSKSSSQIKMYNRQIESENKKMFDAKKKQADIQKKISDTTTKLNKARIDLGKERNKESKKALEKLKRENQNRIGEIIESVDNSFKGADLVSKQKYEHDIFFSYAHEDSEYADSLVKLMKENGIDVVFDKNDLAWGQSIIDFIDNHLRTVKYGIILLTPTYLEKYWATYELKSLLQRHSRSGWTKSLAFRWTKYYTTNLA